MPDFGEPWLELDAFDDTHLGAAAFIGYSQQEVDIDAVLNVLDLPVSKEDITFIDGGGDEWYLILPRYHGTTVTVYTVDLDGNGVAVEDELLVETMNPVLIRCNASDIMPSVSVSMRYGDQQFIFLPHINLENGSPAFPDELLDITPPSVER